MAAIGIVVNTTTTLLFLRGGKHDLNVRGAFLHMAADIALYDPNRIPPRLGLHDVAIAPVACGGGARLRSLLVDGHEIVRNGSLPGLDMAELAAQARQAVKQLIARAQTA